MLRSTLRSTLRSRRLPPILAGVAIVVAFVALNHKAYDGFFQDDDLSNLSLVPLVPAREVLTSLLSPRFQTYNFRPVGYLYFALTGKSFGLDFPPYLTPIFVIHLLNGLLLYLLMRKIGIKQWCAVAATAFFTLSAAGFDVYWKPMYVFDLLCATFSLASILLYSHRRWVLSFIAFWLAYKSKEPAVMLPAVLLAYEYWLGERRFRILIPFLLVSLSFGIQGLVLNPNKDNEYTFRFTLDALRQTTPFYSERFLMFPLSGFLLFGLALVRDRRIWFGLVALSLFMTPLIFLPGRLVGAYAYLPLACATIAIGAAASRWNPVWAWIALAIWMPSNLRELRHQRRATLELDDQIFTFVDAMGKFSERNPGVVTFVYNGHPTGFHDQGVLAAWNLVHQRIDLRALYFGWPEGGKALAGQTVAYGSWDYQRRQLTITVRSPGP